MTSNSDNGWEASAAAWIADMGENGDFGRRYVLDHVMLDRALACRPASALDVGCGEGRFCRLLRARGVDAIGVDPTSRLLRRARELDPEGAYVEGVAEALPFGDSQFDLVVSYLSLIDIPDAARAIAEMTRVLKSGGALLIANLTSFNTAQDKAGRVSDYLEPRASWVEYRNIRILNHHRPLQTYMQALLSEGLCMTYFVEPAPMPGAPPEKASRYCSAPWYVVMEWAKA